MRPHRGGQGFRAAAQRNEELTFTSLLGAPNFALLASPQKVERLGVCATFGILTN